MMLLLYFHFETITEFYKESAPSRKIWVLLGEDGEEDRTSNG